MTGLRICLSVAALSISIGLAAVDERTAGAADVVVVCPSSFEAALQPWLEHRRGEGLEICVVPSEADGQDLRTTICDTSTEDTRYVILIGDAPVIGTPCNELRQTPILYCPTKVTAAWGSTSMLSSDMLFGDFDRDNVPDAVVGRLPVDNASQLESWIERIVARDCSRDYGPWRCNIQLVGGVGGFGMMADRAIESVTRTIVTGVLPADTKTTVCYASPGHLFFPREKSFTDAVLDRYQRGARFWVYAGHGQITELDRVPRGASGLPVLDQRSVRRLNRPAGESPIAVMLACYTGALDAAEDSIAEEMVLCEGGPIAVLAGSRVTMPYGNTTAAVGLIDGVFSQRLPRLGDAWFSALQEMHRDVSEDTSPTRLMIDTLATVVSPAGTDLVEERREHMLLYNLIGDPTLRLHHPQEVTVKVAPGHDKGAKIKLQIESPIAGQLRVSIDRPLGTAGPGDPNETAIASFEGRIEAAETMSPEIELPADYRGPLVIRVMVAGEEQWASAAARTIVR